MDAEALLDALVRGAVQVWLEDGALRWRARKGVMTDELRAGLVAHRAALIERMRRLPERIADWPAELRVFYEERAGIGEHVGGMARAEAERASEAQVRLRVARGRFGE